MVGRHAQYDFKCDIWSLGCTVFEYATLKPPHPKLGPLAIYFKVMREGSPKLPERYALQYSRNMQDFLSKCLALDPDKRPTAPELLQHPWIRSAKGASVLMPTLKKMMQARKEKAEKNQ